MTTSKLVDAQSYSMLNKEQKAAYDELKKIIDGWAHLSEAQKQWLDEACLLRYLRARKFKAKKAKEMLVGTMNWRVEEKPHHIPHTAIYSQATHLSNYVHGVDKHGHPICYMRFERDPPGFSSEEKLKYIKFNLEESLRIMDRNAAIYPGVEKLIYIIDLNGFSMTAPGADTGIASKWGDMLQNHYPERLYKAYLVNYPTIFSFFWRIVSAFMDKVTVEKVHWCNKAPGEKMQQYFLEQGFDLDLLEKPFGGKLDPLKKPNLIGHDDYEDVHHISVKGEKTA
eukprot:TRINITY_DN9926_c0_g1_i1.p1 TRINITY_DN9926_c0_g1~~TRINITY_DN9926_c0_g1_i1.p1  ORF type:complete len:282 (+),score=77.33 TRINITY_DN9926_c0_g1_i1:56-901(+)